jgi:hypothetical protein
MDMTPGNQIKKLVLNATPEPALAWEQGVPRAARRQRTAADGQPLLEYDVTMFGVKGRKVDARLIAPVSERPCEIGGTLVVKGLEQHTRNDGDFGKLVAWYTVDSIIGTVPEKPAQ